MSHKDLLLLLHDEESTTGTTAEWCESRGVSYEIRNAAKIGFFSHPHAKNYRGVIVFGGNMQTWEEEKHPWLKSEKKLLREFAESGKGIFGICLGAQLLADTHGGRVYPLGEWQIGWGPCQLAGRPGSLTPLHWHSSTFDPPPEGELLAWNKEGTKLGLRLSPRVLGYQFHTEIDPKRLEVAMENWKPNLEGDVDDPAKIRADAARHMDELKRWYFAELDAWFAAIPKE